MPDDSRIHDSPLDGSLHPSVARASAMLRAEVPVRRAWRESVVAEIERAARGQLESPSWDGAHHERPHAARRARLVVAWPTAAAAAIMLFGAGAFVGRMGGGDGRRTVPNAPAVTAQAAARPTTRFVLVAPNARHVALVGDFNLWNPASAPMRRIEGSGEWAIDLPLPAGRHAYAFVVDGDITADPSAPRTAGDDFGRPNSVVLVSSPQS